MKPKPFARTRIARRVFVAFLLASFALSQIHLFLGRDDGFFVVHRESHVELTVPIQDPASFLLACFLLHVPSSPGLEEVFHDESLVCDRRLSHLRVTVQSPHVLPEVRILAMESLRVSRFDDASKNDPPQKRRIFLLNSVFLS